MAKPTPPGPLHPDTPAQEAAHSWLAVRIEDVRHHAGRAARALEEEPVHDLRVSLRRLRAACALFGRKELRDEGDELKRTQDAAGAVRDLHVLRGLSAGAAASGQPAPLDAHQTREFARAEEAAGNELLVELARLNSRTLRRLDAALGRQDLPGRLDGQRLRVRLCRLLKTAEARLARAGGLSPKDSHRLRIAVKKLRYGAELLAPALPVLLPPLIAALSPLQDALGALHDVDVLLEQAATRAVPRLHGEAFAQRLQLAGALEQELAEWVRTDRLRVLRQSL